MRSALALVLIATTSVASAQPMGPQPPPDVEPQPQPQPDPPPYPPAPYPTPLPPPMQPVQPIQQVPPPYGYQPVAVQLTVEEHERLQRGEISDMAHVGGGMANVFLGFGIGQAIQGRWSEKGWLFTVGGAASITAMVVGAVSAFENDSNEAPILFIGGYIGFLAFHIWGAVDAFIEPPKHNRKLRELRMRLGMTGGPYYGTRVIPYVKGTDHGGGTAGLVFRF
jgi:hypothetical protein